MLYVFPLYSPKSGYYGIHMEDRAFIFHLLAEEDTEYGLLLSEVWIHALDQFEILNYVSPNSSIFIFLLIYSVLLLFQKNTHRKIDTKNPIESTIIFNDIC